MKFKKEIISIIIIILLFVLVGCNNEKNINNTDDKKTVNEIEIEINTISAEEAKEIMEEEKDIVILDVREEDEYKQGHIKESVLLPLGSLEKNIEKTIKDKGTKILLYCRSGRRSSEAAKVLKELGYTNIYDFGGIIDWKYEVEK